MTWPAPAESWPVPAVPVCGLSLLLLFRLGLLFLFYGLGLLLLLFRLGLLLLFRFSLLLLFLWLCFFFFLCIRGTNSSEKKEQNSRADEFSRFHDYCLHTVISRTARPLRRVLPLFPIVGQMTCESPRYRSIRFGYVPTRMWENE